jgi:hypothetical protein
MKRFDDIFKQQVKDAFDSYNADHLADAGWKALQQKKGNSRWLGLIIPVWAKAASIAILISFAGLFTYRALDNSTLTEVSESTSLENPIPITITPDSAFHQEAIEKTEQKARVIKAKPKGVRAIESTKKIDTSLENEMIAQKVEPELPDSTLEVYSEIDISNKVDEEAVALITTDSTETIDKIPVVVPPNTSQLALFEPEDQSSRTKKTSFYAGLSGMMARLDDMVSNSPGVSVGFYAEHKLTNSISFRPGLALAKHTYDLQNISSSNRYMDAAPMLNGVSGEVVSAETHMDLVAMEVPLNFVFKISENRKRILFISAGASTMIYLSQQFTGSYQDVYTREVYNDATGETSIESNYTNIDVENEYGAFSRVDYFGLANLSAGYSFPLGKSNTMLVEPFVQLPMHDITSSDLRIRFGGLSLKFKFGK